MAGYIGSKSSVTQVDGYTEAEADAEFVNDPNGAITVSGSNVGIGTSSPSEKLTIQSGNLNFMGGTNDAQYIKFGDTGDDNIGSILYYHGNDNMVFTNNASEAMRIDSSGNVGIGTSSPSATLQVVGTTNSLQSVFGSDSSGLKISTFQKTANDAGVILDAQESSNGTLTFATTGTERMRIDSSGKVLVGKTASGMTVNGVELRTGETDDYAFTATSLNQPVLLLNRHTDDGMIIRMRKANSDVGNIGTADGNLLYICSNGNGIKIAAPSSGVDAFGPATTTGNNRDNTMDIGWSSNRFDDIYATNGTIQTSDFNEKQDIASLTATEMLVGKRISALFKTFRWKDSVAENGANARTHTGVIAQDVQAAFTAEGLDAGDYALFISDTWWETQTEVPAVEAVTEVTDEDGNVTTEAVEAVDAYTRTDTYDTEDEAPEGATSKTRLGIRYPELLSFVAAYNEQRFASIEARLTALEA